LSKEEMEQAFVDKYRSKLQKMPYLSVLFTLPIFILVIIVISCIWWDEKLRSLRKEKTDENKLKQNTTEIVISQPSKPKIVSLCQYF